MLTRGSEWNKWDLHLHSKYSLENRTKMEVKDIFESAIKNNIKMISITDHSNFDSLNEIWDLYESVNESNEKYKDLIEFLPGIELKTDKGQKGIHIICIFPKEIEIGKKINKSTKELLYDNFCAPLGLTKAKIEAAGEDDYGKGLVKVAVPFDKTIKLTHELGGLVIIHGGDKHGSIENEMSHSKNKNNYDDVYKALDITKKDIISNNIDLIEIPNFNKKEARNAEFYKSEFNKPCIVGSDAHERKDYEDLGNKFTWVKANTSFNGIKQAIIDYENRIYLKEIPEELERVEKDPTKYLDSLKVTWAEGYSGEKGEWFKDTYVPLNTGLVSVIGNKGNGKSAIAEIISWLADSKKYEKFAFLNSKRFLKNKLANKFIGEIEWKSKKIINKRNLSEVPNINNVERVQSIPQQYFEEICTDTELEKFTKEINSVIFSRLRDEDKEGELSLDSLINKYTKVSKENTNYLKINLSKKNIEIIKLEKKLLKAYKEKLEFKKQDIEKKIEIHKDICPKSIEKLALTPDKQKKYDDILKQIEESQKNMNIKIKELNDHKNLQRDLFILKGEVFAFQSRINAEKLKFENELFRHNLNINTIINNTFNLYEIDKKIDEYNKEILTIENLLGTKDKSGLKFDLSKQMKIKQELISEESRSMEAYRQYIKNYEQWIKENAIKIEERESIDKEILYINSNINEDLNLLYEERNIITKDIFKEKNSIVEIYDKFKKSVDDFLKENSRLIDEYNISIRSGLVIEENFEKEVFNFINKQRKNAFRDDEYNLNKTIDDLLQMDESDDYSNIPNLITEKMKSYDVNIYSQIKEGKVEEFYNYIYGMEYVVNRYELISDKKTLDKLSPGERGALLLIFYLLLDMSDVPLIIDQPEDNLDNQSITKVLVPFIQQAKKRRQIIMVTHNPNLAVVADSDQIIHVKVDKENNLKVIVESGGIEDIQINECLVTILEGTMNSFRKREEKYI